MNNHKWICRMWWWRSGFDPAAGENPNAPDPHPNLSATNWSYVLLLRLTCHPPRRKFWNQWEEEERVQIETRSRIYIILHIFYYYSFLLYLPFLFNISTTTNYNNKMLDVLMKRVRPATGAENLKKMRGEMWRGEKEYRYGRWKYIIVIVLLVK